jgi:molecular chaperone DnaK
MGKEKILGIDLGTSNSQASVMMGGTPSIVPSAEGSTLYGKAFPSVVAFSKSGELLVGEPAKRQAVSNPEGTVMLAKRKMGTDHKFKVNGKEYTPQQISAFLLQKIKADAEAFLGEKISKAVITVPAYFNDNQRTATKDAGKIAGLDVIRLVNEPTAAAMAYGLGKTGKQKILVFDLGGGTLDVTIMELNDGVYNVLSTSGDTQLGGSDMDKTLVQYINDRFKQEQGVDLSKDKMASQRVLEAAEKAKIELSKVGETEINLPYITADANGPKHLLLKLTRTDLEKLLDPIVERCRNPIRNALKDAKLTKNEVDKVILVGGPTRMPSVQRLVEQELGKLPEKTVDPMECVAMGAAIQGAVLAGEINDIVLLDVTPLTLGIETLGSVSTPLIERNTTIPAKKHKVFSTAADMQTAVTIHVLQGERPMAEDNVSLGMFNLTGISPAPRGIPQIDVTFDIDANGILTVSAKDLGTNKEQKIIITASTKLSEDEINKFVNAAKEHEEEDKKKKEEIEIKNTLDTMIYTSEKSFSELQDKLESSEKTKIENALKSAKEILAQGDISKMKSATEDLSKVMQEVGSAIYQRSGAQGQGQAQQGPDPSMNPDNNTEDDIEEEAEDVSEQNKREKKEKTIDAEYTTSKK